MADSTDEYGNVATLDGGLIPFIATYRRHLPLFLAIVAVVFAIAAALTYHQTPRYTATASVVVAPQRSEIGTDKNATDPANESSIDTQVEAIKSRAVAVAVVERLGLEKDPEFAIGGPDAETRKEATVEAVGRSLRVRRVAQTYFLQLSFSSKSPAKAARIINAFADAYISRQVKDKFKNAATSSGLLDGQLNQLRKQVETAEAEVARYKTANNLMSSGGTTLTEQEISALNQQLATVRAQQAESDARLSTARQQLRSGSNGDDVGEALNSQVIQDLRRQRAEVSRRVAEMSDRYGPRYPAIVNAQHELADIDKQIQAEINRIISGLDAQAQVGRQRTASVASSLSQARGSLSSNNAATVRLNELERNAEAARVLYEAVLNRAKESGAQQAMSQADARVSAYAVPPTRPSSPNKPINLALGLLVGAGLGVVAVILRQGLDTGLGTQEQVEKRLGVVHLATLPTVVSSIKKPKSTDPLQAIVSHPLSSFAESFRSLGASLMHGKTAGPVRTIVITSSLPNEGKTTTSICLARTLAMGGTKVVLIDADLRRRSVDAALDLKTTTGMIEVLEGKASLDQALLLDEATGAFILPLAKDAHMAKKPFESEAFDRLLEDLKARFELIILDTAPVLPVVDTRILAGKVDAVALLVRWRFTPAKAVQTALRLLSDVGVQVTGVALTRVNLKVQAKSGYGDSSYYYRDYKAYYLD